MKRADLTCLGHGHYAEQLQPFLDRCGRDNLHIVLNEDLRDEPESAVRNLLGWLGLEPHLAGIDVRARVNEAGVARFSALQRIYSSLDSPMQRWVRRSPRIGCDTRSAPPSRVP